MSNRATSVITAVLLATSLQCQGRKPVQGDAAKGESPGTPFKAAPEELVLEPVASAQELLPPDTQLLLEGGSLARAAEVFDRDKVEKEAPKLYAEMARASQELFGVDVMVPANLPTIGVDPNGPIGIALLDARSEAFAVWVKVSDPGKFREVAIAAANRAGTQLAPLSLGGAEILEDQNGPAALVLREPFAVLVVSRPPRDGQQGVDWARAVGTMVPSQSLAASPKFRKAIAGWVDTDAIAYGDFAALVESTMRDDDEIARAINDNWAKDQLDEARRNGAPPEEIARLEAQVKQFAEDNKRWAQQREAERELVRFVASGFSALSMRIDVKRHGPVIEGRVQQTADAFPRALVRNHDEAPPLTWALDGAPVMLVAGAMEVDAVVDFVDRVARAEGDTWTSVVAEMKEELGIDVDTEIRPLLTGVGGFAITVDGDLMKAPARSLRTLMGFAAHAEVTDPAKAEAAIAKAMAKLDIDGRKFKKNRDGGWSLDVKDWRTVHVKVAGKHVVVSTDPALAGRLAARKEGNIAKRVRPSAAWGAMSMKGQAFTYVQDFGFLAGFLFFGRSFTVPPSGVTTKPKSRSARQLQARIAKLDKQIAALQEKIDAAEQQKMLSVIDPFGSTVLVARDEGDGIVVQGGQFIRVKDLGEVVVRVSTMFGTGADDNPDRTKLHDLLDERFRLEEELRQIEARDAVPPKGR